MYNAIVTTELKWREMQRHIKENYGQSAKLKCHPSDWKWDISNLSEDEIIFSYAISKYHHLIELEL